jgi:hypothetical protein
MSWIDRIKSPIQGGTTDVPKSKRKNGLDGRINAALSFLQIHQENWRLNET